MGTGKVSDWCAVDRNSGLFCVALGDFQKNKRRTLSVMEAKSELSFETVRLKMFMGRAIKSLT